jgi:hypothetical protein
MVARQRFPELLQGPLCGRVGRDVVMENSSCSQFHDHEYIKGAKSGRDHHEEVTRHDHLGMIADKSQPTLLWSGVRAGPLRRYFSTVRGDSGIPSFSLNSLAMRS